MWKHKSVIVKSSQLHMKQQRKISFWSKCKFLQFHWKKNHSKLHSPFIGTSIVLPLVFWLMGAVAVLSISFGGLMRGVLRICVSLWTVGLVDAGVLTGGVRTPPWLGAPWAGDTIVVCSVSHLCWAFKMNTMENLKKTRICNVSRIEQMTTTSK